MRELKEAMDAIAREVESNVVEGNDLQFRTDPMAPMPSATTEPDEGFAERATRPGIASVRPRGAPPDTGREAMTRALSEAHGNLTHAAELLGISRNTLKKYLDFYGMRPTKRST